MRKCLVSFCDRFEDHDGHYYEDDYGDYEVYWYCHGYGGM